VFTPKPVLDKALRRKVAVNFFGNEGTIIGHLSEYDGETYVFEQCSTSPESRDESPRPLSGRIYVDRINCWLQELPT
jgi:small nuclear ribonucleoprotein (snRNP)-like protein